MSYLQEQQISTNIKIRFKYKVNNNIDISVNHERPWILLEDNIVQPTTHNYAGVQCYLNEEQGQSLVWVLLQLVDDNLWTVLKIPTFVFELRCLPLKLVAYQSLESPLYSTIMFITMDRREEFMPFLKH